MGLINQAAREIKQFFSNLWRSLPFHKKKKRGIEHKQEESIEIPASWRKSPRPGDSSASSARARKQIIVEKHKIRVPGLRWFKRCLASFLLLINFVFSQFLLGRVGEQGQPLFILFLLNSFIMADYLWKTRKTSQ
jgi:hypothetical protein